MAFIDQLRSLAQILTDLDPASSSDLDGLEQGISALREKASGCELLGLTVFLEGLDELAGRVRSEPTEERWLTALTSQLELLLDVYLDGPDEADPQTPDVPADQTQEPDAAIEPDTSVEPETSAETNQDALPKATGADTDLLVELDQELLGMFLSEAETSLEAMEVEAVQVEAADNKDELTANIRRTIHTFKGECGVIPLPSLQEVCHEAETLIDARMEAGAAFPTDEILALVDWIRTYSACLLEGEFGDIPSNTEMLGLLKDSAARLDDSNPVPDPVEDRTIDPTPPTKAETETEAEAESEFEIWDDDFFAPPSEETKNTAEDACPVLNPVTEAENSNSSPTESNAEPGDSDELISFDIDDEYVDTLDEFLQEAADHLREAEGAMLELDPLDADRDLIDKTFRAFHTIKGVAGFLNLTSIVRLAHTAEALLDELRKDNIEISDTIIDAILASCDSLTALLDVLVGKGELTKGQLDTLIANLQSITLGEAGEKREPSKSKPAPVIEQAVEAALPRPEAPKPVILEKKEPQPEAASIVPTPAPRALPGPEKQSTKKPKKKGRLLAAGKNQTITVNTTRLDNIVDMVGELVIAQTMVMQDPTFTDLQDQNMMRNLTRVSKITRDLQERAMSLRMVTVKSTFQKMARLVRDVSLKAGKEVQLDISGEETELDRNVVEEIGDPLVHMIRNAVDHGIEEPDVRVRAGKDRSGTLNLKAYHQGGNIVIEITDDGQGLNRDRILDKARERGLIPPGTVESEIPDREVFNMIFLPGFSTAEKVTDISGRGVGMDVVRRNIEALRGKVEIDSVYGKGSSFKMRLPLTLAIIDGMIVRTGRERYVIPTQAIIQSFQSGPDARSTILKDGETVRVRDRIYPIYRLKRVLELTEGEDDLNKGLLILIEVAAGSYCLHVDEILGQQQVVIKNLGKGHIPLKGVSGGAIMGDGKVALILDMNGIFQECVEVGV